MDRHLGNFHFLASMNNASTNIVYKFLCGHNSSNSFVYIPKHKIAGSCDDNSV